MDENTPGFVYLLHFDKPYKHAQHYLGWTSDLERRLRSHRSGNRNYCVLTSVITWEGIAWRVARLWSGTLGLEKKLKRQKGNKRLCPICNPKLTFDEAGLRKYNKHNKK